MKINEGDGAGQIRLRQLDPAEVSPGGIRRLGVACGGRRKKESAEGARRTIVVIDSLNGYLNSMPHDDYLNAQLHELLSYLNNTGVATFLIVAQSGLMGSAMSAPVEASYLADTVVMLRYFEHQGNVKKAISALKKRTGSHEEAIREIWFDEKGIHLSEPLMRLRGILTGVPIELESRQGDWGRANGDSSKANAPG